MTGHITVRERRIEDKPCAIRQYAILTNLPGQFLPPTAHPVMYDTEMSMFDMLVSDMFEHPPTWLDPDEASQEAPCSSPAS